MPGPGRPAGTDVPQHRHDAERGQDVEAVPLRSEGQAQHQPGPPAPGAPAETEGVADVLVRADPAVGARDHEEHQHAVEQRGPAHHEVQAVDRHQRARQTAEERRAEHPAADPAQQQDGEGPQQRRHEPPAERVEPEHQLAEADDVLADRRVHDIGRVRGNGEVPVRLQDEVVGVLVPVDLVAAVDERPGVLGVVRLVEYHRTGAAQVPEPHQARHQRHQQWTAPARPAGDPLREDRRPLPQARARLGVRRHQAVAYVARGCFLDGRVPESAQPLLPRRPLVVRRLALPEVRGGRGTGHRAIVGNPSV